MFCMPFFFMSAYEFKPLPSEKPEITIMQDAAYNFIDDARSEKFETAFYTFVDAEELEGDFGLLFASNRVEGVARVDWEPFRFDSFAFGPTFTYHLYRNYNTFTEQDFLPGILFDFYLTPQMTLSFFTDAILKYALIDGAGDLFNISFALGFNYTYEFQEGFGLKAYLGTIDFFDIELPFCLFADFGLYKNFYKNFFGAADVYLKYTDVICNYPYPVQAGVKLSWGVNL